MRLTLAAILLSLAIPAADAASPKAVCKNRCDSNYEMCQGRSRTKNAKKSCKVDRKLCKSTCGK
jgi:hypothetical protein